MKRSKLTRPQQHALVGALLFGHVPAVFVASVRALRREGLVKSSSMGNVVLTSSGRVIARAIFKFLSSRVK